MQDNFDVYGWNRKMRLNEAEGESNKSKSNNKTVTIPKDLTTDPINRQGKTGTVIGKNIKGDTTYVEFPDGKIGLYDSDIFNPMNEAEETKWDNPSLEDKIKDILEDTFDNNTLSVLGGEADITNKWDFIKEATPKILELINTNK